MQTRYEHFAVGSMMGQADTPPRANGALCFARPWERKAFGMALALAREGHFEWDDFRRELMVQIGNWEDGHALDDPDFDYYDCFLSALERVVSSHLPEINEAA